MQNAYLILAHGEFLILQELVNALDQSNNSLFIHYDAKVKQLPDIKVHYAQLVILNCRESVYWGHISMVKAQYHLWEEAVQTKNFDAYHLLSGVHFPLVSSTALNDYWNSNAGKCLFSPMKNDSNEIQHKMKRVHVGIKYFHHKNKIVRRISHYLWLIALKVQKIFNIQRYPNSNFFKSSQWHSLSHEAVKYLIEKKQHVIEKYRYTFCPDEFFVLTEIYNSDLRDTVMYNDKILLTDFVNVSPKVYTINDYEYLKRSGYLFARKFSENSFEIINKLKEEARL